MDVIISKDRKENTLLDDVIALSGIDISACLQCKKCSNGCPVNKMTKSSPSEVIRRLQLGLSGSVLNSDLVWMCASCETCYSRCPMKINMAMVMDALRIISVKKNSLKKKSHVSIFNKSFLRTVRIFGRTYDLGMIAMYKVRTSSYLQDTEKFPMMLKKGKIALLPSFKADRSYVKRIFKNIPKKKVSLNE